jgi:hypothetical protein
MSAEADAICGAPYGERSPERTNSRNGYRTRDFDTRAGTMAVAIRKLPEGSYFPDWLLERRRPAERALTTVVATCYLLGVSTRRMEKLVETLGISRLSKSQVSAMAKELDAHVEDFRTRPLDQGPYTFLAADALTMKVREGGRLANTHVLGRHRRQRRRPPRDPRRGRLLGRVRGRLADPVPRPERPRPVRGQASHLRCPQRPRGGLRLQALPVLVEPGDPPPRNTVMTATWSRVMNVGRLVLAQSSLDRAKDRTSPRAPPSQTS